MLLKVLGLWKAIPLWAQALLALGAAAGAGYGARLAAEEVLDTPSEVQQLASDLAVLRSTVDERFEFQSIQLEMLEDTLSETKRIAVQNGCGLKGHIQSKPAEDILAECF